MGVEEAFILLGEPEKVCKKAYKELEDNGLLINGKIQDEYEYIVFQNNK